MNDTGRTETFSDGVLAIAITLLVLDLSVPLRDELHGSLAHALGREWPQYAAYVTSFLVIGIIWVNHHALFALIRKVDRPLLFANLLLLMCVGAIPFTTSLLAEYLTAGGSSAHTAAVVYSAVMLAMSFCFAAVFGYASRRPELLEPSVDAGVMRASTLRFSLLGTVLYLVTVVVALFSAPACLAVHLAIALYYCFQQIRA
ncbi:MAG TPA: TMEM175 family protein [Micromonosporaceae bacterium]